jgi:hypothetical protein
MAFIRRLVIRKPKQRMSTSKTSSSPDRNPERPGLKNGALAAKETA